MLPLTMVVLPATTPPVMSTLKIKASLTEVFGFPRGENQMPCATHARVNPRRWQNTVNPKGDALHNRAFRLM
ncbi:MAG: hypothetical protein WB500_05850 [Rhodoplanes sp.]